MHLAATNQLGWLEAGMLQNIDSITANTELQAVYSVSCPTSKSDKTFSTIPVIEWHTCNQDYIFMETSLVSASVIPSVIHSKAD